LHLSSGNCILYQSSSSTSFNRDTCIGLNLKLLVNGLKKCTDNHELYMIIDEDSLTLHTVHKSNRSRVTEYKISQFLTIEQGEYEMDGTVKYDAEVLMPTKELNEAIDECKSVSCDRINVTLAYENRNAYLKFKSNSEVASNKSVFTGDSIPFDWLVPMNDTEKYKVTNGYSLRVLSTVTKTCQISDNVLLQIGKDCPLSFSYMLDYNMGTFRFWVAPYVDDEVFSEA
jgi:DNA polymerase III sliding clamp (beta) subunit (PCNA family)